MHKWPIILYTQRFSLLQDLKLGLLLVCEYEELIVPSHPQPYPSPIIFGVIETLCCCSRPWAQKFTKIRSEYEDVGMTRDKSQTYFTTQGNFANPYFWNGFVCGRLENWCVSDEATPTFFVLPLSNKHFGHWFLFEAKKYEKNWTYPRNFNKKCLLTNLQR